MTGSRFRESTGHRLGGRFAELLKVQAKLALREPYGLLGGIALPAVLLAVFGFIGQQVPGNVGDTGLTIIDLWTPTVLVIAFLAEIFWLLCSWGWRRPNVGPVRPRLGTSAQS